MDGLKIKIFFSSSNPVPAKDGFIGFFPKPTLTKPEPNMEWDNGRLGACISVIYIITYRQGKENYIPMKFILILCLLLLDQSDDRKAEREKMVKDQIANRGINDPAILDAMRKVLRHRLVPENQKQDAYQDSPLPIGKGQTISQPFVVAYMTEMVKPEKGMKVLEIGTGSGYQAAVLAEIVDEVFTLEIIPELGQKAERDLKELGYDNIHVRIADGYNGWEEHAPFDAIVVTASPDHIPPSLISQLKEGGRMIIPIESGGLSQQLVLVEKIDGKIHKKNVLPVRFVPFTRSKE
ncbi:MAG: protein-L-isoaspartate(D-aspartate) O-methyltransferase [Anditalea sp.]